MARANRFPDFRLKELVYVIGLLSSSFPLRALCQDKVILAQEALAEKIYLQLDGNGYTTGETIWFKAVFTDAAFHLPTSLSGVLHVELIGPNAQIFEQKLIKIEKGTGEGYFDLPADFPAGTYLYLNLDKRKRSLPAVRLDTPKRFTGLLKKQVLKLSRVQ